MYFALNFPVKARFANPNFSAKYSWGKTHETIRLSSEHGCRLGPGGHLGGATALTRHGLGGL
jgi:hypothetical protein